MTNNTYAGQCEVCGRAILPPLTTGSPTAIFKSYFCTVCYMLATLGSALEPARDVTPSGKVRLAQAPRRLSLPGALRYLRSCFAIIARGLRGQGQWDNQTYSNLCVKRNMVQRRIVTDYPRQDPLPATQRYAVHTQSATSWETDLREILAGLGVSEERGA